MLYIITWLTDFTAFLLVFAVSRQLAEQNHDALTLGLSGTLFAGSITISNFMSGRLSDKIGFRRVTIIAMCMLMLSLVTVLLTDVENWIFIVAFGLSGIAFGAIYPSIIAWLSHGKRGRHASRALLGFSIAFNIGMISGQTTGGWLFQQFGSNAPTWTAMILLVGAMLLVLCCRDESRLHCSAKDQPDDTPYDALSTAYSRLAWLANIGGTFSASSVIFLLPKLVVHLDIASQQHGILLASSRIIVISCLLSMHFFTFWHHRFRVSLGVQILGLVGLIVISRATSLGELHWGLGALSVLLGYNYFSSLFYSATGSPDDKKGMTLGFHEGTLALGMTGGSLLGGIVGSLEGDRAPFVLAAVVISVLALAQIAVYWKWIRFVQRSPEAPPAAAS